MYDMNSTETRPGTYGVQEPPCDPLGLISPSAAGGGKKRCRPIVEHLIPPDRQQNVGLTKTFLDCPTLERECVFFNNHLTIQH